eukprot:CAMPEP_0172179052 /NCGR_PEP_ID=MMETSP1050-20130122/16391_1 /TAXON_ID=233186 /ORGANISM="Cryptomonas curvata, Strain CCAP979/52" /LENGTH=355 /DNA_ID=CAMNT_0012851867 /DNA_START=24 /DNA_END=1092 /DNA_ORIENTATION=+
MEPRQLHVEHTQWLAKVSAVQREKMGTDEWNEVVRRGEMMRTSMRACAKTSSATSRLREVKSGMQTSLSEMAQVRLLRSDPAAMSANVHQVYEGISRRAEVSIAQVSREETEDVEICRWNMERQMVQEVDIPESRSHDETAKLSFEEFRAIPTDEAEEAAKFLLYETFAKACEEIRGQVFAFYDDNKSNLGPRVCAAMSKTLADIDRTENLGTVEDESTWFVLGMARQVDANATMMMNVLADFGRRLELLGAADQSCPVCLDAFEPEGPHAAEVLGCCHSVCRECWAHMELLAHGPAPCPLCRRQDFMLQLSSSVEAARGTGAPRGGRSAAAGLPEVAEGIHCARRRPLRVEESG